MLDKKALKKRVLDKLVAFNAKEIDKLKETFIAHVKEIDKMNHEELEKVNDELLRVLHKETPGIGLGTYFRSN